MRKTHLLASFGTLAAALMLLGQDVIVKLQTSDRPAIALPELRGSGGAQKFMDIFNQTLWSDIANSGLFKMVAKSMMPLHVPQRPEDFRHSAPALPPRRGSQASATPSGNGLLLSDWANPPVSATYAVVGYTAVQLDQLVLRGWMYNVTQPDLANAQVLAKTYLAPVDENGARKLAHDFASDILSQFGARSIANTNIYFVRQEGRAKEIWSMSVDGSNQQPVTSYGSLSFTPAVSPDSTRIAFTSYARGNPAIFIHSLQTGLRLAFYNQVASAAATPEFTPDGERLVYALSLDGFLQVVSSNLQGGDLRRISSVRAIEVEPKVNPKTGAELVFVSGRAGPQQIFKMSMEGLNVERLTTGEGEASNPAWHPDGEHIAFALDPRIRDWKLQHLRHGCSHTAI